jgi:outer membrane protein OmpA-like peptidoglycan-associated protein
MNQARGVVVLLAVAAGLNLACGPLRSKTPVRTGQDLVVLLPEADGTVGRATVSNPSGNVDLATVRASTRVTAGQAPTAVSEISDAEIQQLFGAALAAQPPASSHFLLYFRFDSEELTDESRALLGQVLQVLKNHPAPRVSVIGHTDTTGSAASNVELGLRRANAVRAMLIETGLDGASVDVTSHGEATLLITTADEVFEPRNRRVEITVR